MPKIIDSTGVKKVGVGKDKAKTTNVAKSIQPTFFHESLTGHGGNSRGLLNDTFDPKHYAHGYPVKLPTYAEFKSASNGNLKIHTIPLYIIPPSAWSAIKTIDTPDVNDMTLIATKGNAKVYLDMQVNIIQVEKEKVPSVINSTTPTSSTVTRVSANFQMFVYNIADPNNKTCANVNYTSNLNAQHNTFAQEITNDCVMSLRDLERTLSNNGYTTDKQSLNDYLQNYSLYADICKKADKWEKQTDYFVADVLAKNLVASNTQNTYYLELTISQLERYNVPLDSFHNMYKKLAKLYPADVLTKVCKSHLNLMLSNTLHEMDVNRNLLKSCPNNNTTVLNSVVDGHTYSYEQKNAIASTSPLTLIQSGAGTGKSTIILARIAHMIANGIDPQKILVLSFTNAAANHILDENPDVKSMTIDAMMRKIYNYNYPDHELSSISTIINSLEIYYDPNTSGATSATISFVRDFANVLNRLRNNKAYTNAMNFIEDHLDEVIDTLNTIGQTSLELQLIICYYKMNDLVEPPEFNIDHLIIDEVQDNSVFQFIYAITYTSKHFNSLYLVGDCSQTLYEFRASNPKALNMLEGSGVFATYKLQTNYRSCQEILDFANIALSNIEANRYAQIQLKANDLTPVTVDSFKKAVNLSYRVIKDKSHDTMKAIYADTVISAKDFIEDKLAKGEKITVLAFKRDIANGVGDMLLKQYPTVPKIDPVTKMAMLDANGNPIMEASRLVSIMSTKQYDNTDFSKFIRYYWGQIKYAPHADILTTIEREFYANLNNIAYKNSSINQKILNTAKLRMQKFVATHRSHISELQKDVSLSLITSSEMLNQIQKMMIDFEIRENGCLQAVMSNRNEEQKKKENIQNAHFVISTVHGAKGLEFDNVIVMYDGSSDENMTEELKRLYYVALTRAKNSEFIFAYDKIQKPKIGRDYDRIIALLAKQNNASAAGTSSGSDDDGTNTNSPVTVEVPAE